MGEAFLTRRGGGGGVKLEGISVKTPPIQTAYLPGDTFDTTGMVIAVDFGIDGLSAVTTIYTVPPETISVDDTTVTISLTIKGVTKTCAQAISIATLAGIAITTAPIKVDYNYGDTFDAMGMVVTATYSNGAVAVVNGWTCTPNEALTHNDTAITVSCTERGVTKTATQAVTIAKVLGSIAITTPPDKVTYMADSAFDSAGMAVTATYSDGSTANVVTDCAFTPSTIAADTTEVTVSYTYNGVTKTTTQTVSIATYDTVFGNNDWDIIASMAASGQASGIWNVGDEKTAVLNGATYTLQIIGFNHDDLAPTDAGYGNGTYNGGTNKAGITLALKECFTSTYCMNSSNTNSGGWGSSYMRSTIMPTMKGYMPANLQGVLRTVNKKASAGSQSSSISIYADQLFLLAELEVFGVITHSRMGEGTRYAYYTGGAPIGKTRGGSAQWFWLRSPLSGHSSSFCSVHSDGYASFSAASYSGGVAFGFCV